MDDLTQRYYEAEVLPARRGKNLRLYPDRAAMLNLDKPGARDPADRGTPVRRLCFFNGQPAQKLDDDLLELTEGLVTAVDSSLPA